METEEASEKKSEFLRIICPICSRDIHLDKTVYLNYEGIVTCHGEFSRRHKIYIKIKNCELLESPQPIYVVDPEFESPPIPREILEDFKEASICYVNTASKACVVMCGRTLEGLTIEQKAKGRNLNQKIEHLYKNDLISKLLYDAFTKVRVIRNLGAHFQPLNKIEKGEDKKILDITKHIIEHIYILPLRLK